MWMLLLSDRIVLWMKMWMTPGLHFAFSFGGAKERGRWELWLCSHCLCWGAASGMSHPTSSVTVSQRVWRVQDVPFSTARREELGGSVFTNNCNYFRKWHKCKPERHNSLPRSDSSAQGKQRRVKCANPNHCSVLLVPPKQRGRSRKAQKRQWEWLAVWKCSWTE